MWPSLFFAVPITASACEPILPLAQLLSGASAVGPLYFTRSLFWLALAVMIKSVAFIYFERRLTWFQAALLMFVANIVSTIPGVLIAVLTASGPVGGLVLASPGILILGWMVQRRTRRLSPSPRLRFTGGIALLAFVGFFIVSVVLYEMAGAVLEGHSYAKYWMLKFLFVVLVACTGIVISAVLEESVIAGLSRKPAASFYHSVFRANYVTLGLILFVAALKILPERLHSPHFLTSYLDSILAGIGLG